MIVTPKEIDELIDNMKEIVAKRNKLCTIIIYLLHKLLISAKGRKDIKGILYLFLFYGYISL